MFTLGEPFSYGICSKSWTPRKLLPFKPQRGRRGQRFRSPGGGVNVWPKTPSSSPADVEAMELPVIHTFIHFTEGSSTPVHHGSFGTFLRWTFSSIVAVGTFVVAHLQPWRKADSESPTLKRGVENNVFRFMK